MNKYSSIVRIEFDGNEFEADSKEEYIKKVILSFKEEFNIELDEHEIEVIKILGSYQTMVLYFKNLVR